MAAQQRHSRHGRRSPGRGVLLGAGAAALVALGIVAGLLLAPSSGGDGGGPPVSAEPAPAAGTAAEARPAAPAANPTVIGKVTRVVTGDVVVVRTGSTDTTVRIAGLDTPDPMPQPAGSRAECGSADALRRADETLTGETVTLVPDPTVPAYDEQGRRIAHVVLRSQLSYTDAALLDGIGRVDTSRRYWYTDVFEREQGEAVDADRGIWGSPCNEKP